MSDPVEFTQRVAGRVMDDGRHEVHFTVCVGDQQMHLVGIGATDEEARGEVERSFASAIKDLEQLADIRHRTGPINWSRLRGIES